MYSMITIVNTVALYISKSLREILKVLTTRNEIVTR